MSLVLRHQPDVLNIQLDEQGWTSVPILLEKLKSRFPQITIEKLEEVVRTNDKQRFAFNDDHSLIRANQGHSVNIDLGLETATPPAVLYHGTATRFLDSIFEKGLIKGSRQHVHLSDNLETASKVGVRHGKLAILKVDCTKMLEAGFSFYRSKNGVWLTEHVPAGFISR